MGGCAVKSILEQLYDGELAPDERFRYILDGYREAQKNACASYSSFREKLPPNLSLEFEVVIDLHLQQHSFEQKQSFIDGFCLGAALIFEIFQ